MTVFCKLAIIWVVIGVKRGLYPLEVQTVVLMIRTKRLREHDDSET